MGRVEVGAPSIRHTFDQDFIAVGSIRSMNILRRFMWWHDQSLNPFRRLRFRAEDVTPSDFALNIHVDRDAFFPKSSFFHFISHYCG